MARSVHSHRNICQMSAVQHPDFQELGCWVKKKKEKANSLMLVKLMLSWYKDFKMGSYEGNKTGGPSTERLDREVRKAAGSRAPYRAGTPPLQGRKGVEAHTRKGVSKFSVPTQRAGNASLGKEGWCFVFFFSNEIFSS